MVETERENAGAHYLIGVVRMEAGQLEDARAALRRAVSLAPDRVSFLITLGNLELAREDPAEAVVHFDAALERDAKSIPALINRGTALKRLGRLAEALASFRAALEHRRPSRWSVGDEHQPAVSDEETFAVACRAKLQHDVEQYRLLLARGRLPASFTEQAEAHERVLNNFQADAQPSVARPLRVDEREQIGASFNRLVYRPPDVWGDDPALASSVDGSEITARYFAADPRLVVVDDFLSHEALASLRQFCEEATVWFDCKEHGGYLGAYMNEGFDPPALVALARSLVRRVPGIFADHHLSQMWAFKYGASGLGTRKHADAAAINVNFWLTPDEACLDPAGGGLRVYPVRVPADWEFERYNRDPAELDALIRERGAEAIEIPYRTNRCVIFDSSLIHESMSLRFRPGYENRRINVTMLFGDR